MILNLAVLTAITAMATPPKRNILMIYVDDLRWQGFGELGPEFMQTPNFARLMKVGQAHVNYDDNSRFFEFLLYYTVHSNAGVTRRWEPLSNSTRCNKQSAPRPGESNGTSASSGSTKRGGVIWPIEMRV